MFDVIWYAWWLISHYFMGWYGCKFTFEYFWPRIYPTVDLFIDQTETHDTGSFAQEIYGLPRYAERLDRVLHDVSYGGKPKFIFEQEYCVVIPDLNYTRPMGHVTPIFATDVQNHIDYPFCGRFYWFSPFVEFDIFYSDFSSY